MDQAISQLQNSPEIDLHMLCHRPIEQIMTAAVIVGLIAFLGIVRWRFSVQNARRLNAAITAYTALTLSDLDNR